MRAGRFVGIALLATMLFGSSLIYMLGVPLVGAEAADIVAKKTTETIVIDGVAEDIWGKVPGVDIPLTASTTGGGKVASVTIKTLHDGANIYVLATWSDPTEDSVWHTPEQYPDGPFEDRIAVMLPIGSVDMQFPCMKFGTSGAVTAGEVDLWHWHAARDDSDGKNFTTTSPAPKGFQYHPYPVADDQFSNITDRYNDAKVGGNRDDIRAKGRYADGVWTVEMMRAVAAPDSLYDAPLTEGTTIQVAFAVYDGGRAETEAVKSTSPWKTLQISSESLVPAGMGGITYYVVAGIIVAVVIAAGVYIAKRRKQPSKS